MNLWELNMKKSLKEKLNKIKSKIDQIKYDKQKNDVIDFSNRKQRSKFYEELNKEVKDYNKNYQKILERREYLDKKEIPKTQPDLVSLSYFIEK